MASVLAITVAAAIGLLAAGVYGVIMGSRPMLTKSHRVSIVVAGMHAIGLWVVAVILVALGPSIHPAWQAAVYLMPLLFGCLMASCMVAFLILAWMVDDA